MRENPIRPRHMPPQEMPYVRETAFFKTIAGPDATPYPDEADDPTVYYARRQKDVSFTETVGAQSLSTTNTERYAHIYNLSQGYLSEGTVVKCDKFNGQWYTVDPVKGRTLAAVIADKVYGLNAESGATRWTFDLTTLDEAGFVYGLQCRWDSAGRLWGSALAWDDESSDTTPRVMVYRLSRSGALQWSTDLGAVNDTGVTFDTVYSAFNGMLNYGDVRQLADGRICVSHMRLSNAGEVLSIFDADGTLDEQWGASNITTTVSNSSVVTGHLVASRWYGFGGLAQDINGNLWLTTPTAAQSGFRLWGMTLAGSVFTVGAYDDGASSLNDYGSVQGGHGVAAHPSVGRVYVSQQTNGGTLTGDDPSEAEHTIQLSDIASEQMDLDDQFSIESLAATASDTPLNNNQSSPSWQVALYDTVIAVAGNGWLLSTSTNRVCRELCTVAGLTASAVIVDDQTALNSGDSTRCARVCLEPKIGSGGVFWGRWVARTSGTTASIPLVQRSSRAGTIEWSALEMSGSPHMYVSGLDCSP